MVFVKRTREEESHNVFISMGKRGPMTKGTVGLEIEVEGSKLPKEGLPSPWEYHKDGSLRGKDNAEYVLAKPIEFKAVDKALDALWAKFGECKSVLDESNRTSVHVHLNTQSFFLNRLTSLMALYFTFEEVLTEWCGEHRVGNLFCLRAKDAPAIISQIRRFIQTDMEAPLQDHLHYAGMNAAALRKFGSLEFRTLKGVSNPIVIKNWLSILQRFYELSGEIKDPREICDMFSAEGPLAFFDKMLGDMAVTIREGITMTPEQIRDSMYDGIRMAQDLCYARDWSTYKPVEVKLDPFGRMGVRKTINDFSEAVTLSQAFNNTFAVNTTPAWGLPPMEEMPEPEPDWHDDDDDMDDEEF